MAFPTVQSITETNNSGVTSHSFNIPATVDSGDLLLLLVGLADDGENPTTPTGWTKLIETNLTAFDSMVIYAKVADGTEDGGSVSVTTDTTVDSSGQMYRITGWEGSIANGIEVSSSVTDTSSTTANPPDLNPAAWGTEDTLWIAVVVHDPFRSLSSYPTNYTNGTWTKSGTLSTDSSIASARRELNAANENPGTFTFASTTNSIANTIAISPVISTAWSAVVNEAITFDGSSPLTIPWEAVVNETVVFTGSSGIQFDFNASVSETIVFDGSSALAPFNWEAVVSDTINLGGSGEMRIPPFSPITPNTSDFTYITPNTEV